MELDALAHANMDNITLRDFRTKRNVLMTGGYAGLLYAVAEFVPVWAWGSTVAFTGTALVATILLDILVSMGVAAVVAGIIYVSWTK